MPAIRRYLSASRNELKGIAILWVVFFHAQLGLEGLGYQIQRIGYGGVDLFFFLSGFGLYHSLERSSDLRGYLKRRCERLLPSYLPFCLLWLAVMLPLYGAGIATSLKIAAGNLTMTGFWAGAELNINWYPSAMLLSFALAPLFHAVLSGTGKFWQKSTALLAGLFVCGLAFIGNDCYMAAARMPVFVLGMMFAAKETDELSARKLACGMSAAFVLGLAVLFVCLERFTELLNTYAMYWHPFVLITPGLCAGLAWLFVKAPRMIGKPFALLGKASFEIFLFNAWIEVLGKRYGLAKTPAEWLAWSALSIAAGCLYHWGSGQILKRRK